MKVSYNYQIIFEQKFENIYQNDNNSYHYTWFIYFGYSILFIQVKSFISTAPVKYKNALNLKNKRFKAFILYDI